jgi:hypothetical protein
LAVVHLENGYCVAIVDIARLMMPLNILVEYMFALELSKKKLRGETESVKGANQFAVQALDNLVLLGQQILWPSCTFWALNRWSADEKCPYEVLYNWKRFRLLCEYKNGNLIEKLSFQCFVILLFLGSVLVISFEFIQRKRKELLVGVGVEFEELRKFPMKRFRKRFSVVTEEVKKELIVEKMNHLFIPGFYLDKFEIIFEHGMLIQCFVI